MKITTSQPGTTPWLIQQLEGRVDALREEMLFILDELAQALCTHTRTDLAPDAALPKMKKLVSMIKKKRGLR